MIERRAVFLFVCLSSRLQSGKFSVCSSPLTSNFLLIQNAQFFAAANDSQSSTQVLIGQQSFFRVSMPEIRQKNLPQRARNPHDLASLLVLRSFSCQCARRHVRGGDGGGGGDDARARTIAAATAITACCRRRSLPNHLELEASKRALVKRDRLIHLFARASLAPFTPRL